MLWRKSLPLVAFVLGGICLSKAAYIPTKGVFADVLIARAWDQSQINGSPVLPWPWMDAQPLVLLSVPRLNHREIILDVVTGQALGFAPSHLQQTPRPGQPGLSVIAAHKNTHFAFLEQIEVGDIIKIETIKGDVTRFEVTSMEIVDKERSGIDLDEPKIGAQIALVTCYPFSALSYGGPLRYVVYAEAIKPTDS